MLLEEAFLTVERLIKVFISALVINVFFWSTVVNCRTRLHMKKWAFLCQWLLFCFEGSILALFVVKVIIVWVILAVWALGQFSMKMICPQFLTTEEVSDSVFMEETVVLFLLNLKCVLRCAVINFDRAPLIVYGDRWLSLPTQFNSRRILNTTPFLSVWIEHLRLQVDSWIFARSRVVFV